MNINLWLLSIETITKEGIILENPEYTKIKDVNCVEDEA